MHYQPIKEYLKSKEMREQTKFVIVNGVGYYERNGLKFSRQEFEEAWPLGDRVLMHDSQWKGENPDKTHV